jgi:hypothetical protein
VSGVTALRGQTLKRMLSTSPSATT